MKRIDLTGQRFYRWIVLSYAGYSPKSGSRWLCRCDCGTVKTVATKHLRAKHNPSHSCGCLSAEVASATMLRHGLSNSPEHVAWQRMRGRCNNPKEASYIYYGARGIRVCDKWESSFEDFLSDVGLRPSPEHSLDRIDTNGHYEPGNVRWADRRTQATNTRYNHRVTLNGETLTIVEWSERIGIRSATISKRLQLGMSAEQALSNIDRRSGKTLSARRPKAIVIISTA